MCFSNQGLDLQVFTHPLNPKISNILFCIFCNTFTQASFQNNILIIHNFSRMLLLTCAIIYYTLHFKKEVIYAMKITDYDIDGRYAVIT